jgi:hypothetical protein
MLHAPRLVTLAAAVLLVGCLGVPIENQFWASGVRPEEWAEIRAEMAKISPARVVLCDRGVNSEGKGRVMVTTEHAGDYKHYWAEKIRGKWRIKEIEGIITAANASNQAMQLTASKPAVYPWSVCRRSRMLRFMHRGLAAADLVSR